MEVELWLLAVAPVVSALVGTWVGGRMSSRQAEAHWVRTIQMQKLEWEREDERRWDEHRLRAYSEYTAAFTSQRMKLQWIRDKGYDGETDFGPVMEGAATMLQSLTEVRLVSGSPKINDAAHQITETLGRVSSAAMKGVDDTEWNKLHNEYVEALEEFEAVTQQQLKIIMSGLSGEDAS